MRFPETDGPTGAEGIELATRYGGPARLPVDAGWPSSPERPMTFTGQLALADLPAPNAAARPPDGVLSLFVEIDEYLWLGRDPLGTDRQPWAVRYCPPGGGRLVEPPRDLEPPRHQQPMTLSVVELRSGISLPQLGDRAIWELDDQGVVHSPLGEDEEDPYQEFLDEHSDRQDATLHQLGGYALWAQDDPRSCTRL